MTAPSQQVTLTAEVLDYLLSRSDPLPRLITIPWAGAADLGKGNMQIAPDQAVLLRFLLRLIGARRVLEIGTFLGLSALVMADAMGPEGRIVSLDVDAEWAQRARELWEQAGVMDRIELRVGDAHDTLRGVEGFFDAVLIDADKTGYADYLEQVTPRLRPGGLLMVDNTLWYGRVVDPGDDSSDTVALRRFNESLAEHPDYDVAMVAVGDGFTLATKLPLRSARVSDGRASRRGRNFSPI